MKKIKRSAELRDFQKNLSGHNYINETISPDVYIFPYLYNL